MRRGDRGQPKNEHQTAFPRGISKTRAELQRYCRHPMDTQVTRAPARACRPTPPSVNSKERFRCFAHIGACARAPPAKGSRVLAARITTRTCPLVCDAVGGGGGAGVVSRTHVVEPPTKRGFSAAAEVAAAGPVVPAVGAAVEADTAVVAEAAAGGAGGRANLPPRTAGRGGLKPPMPLLPRRIVL